MKIMYIGQMIGGLNIYVRNAITNCPDDTIEFVIVCGKKDKHVPIQRNGKTIREHGISLYRDLNPLWDFIGFIQVLWYVCTERPDIIHCHSAKGGVFGRLAGWLTGRKTYYTAHAFGFLCTPSRLKRNIFLYIERLTKMNAFLLACSESELKLGTNYVKYNKKHALVWHNSVPDASLLTKDSEEKTATPEDRYICYIGRPCYQKNTLFLAEVMKKVKEMGCPVKLKLLGVGYYSSDLSLLKEKIKEEKLEDTIQLNPWISHEECLKIVKDALFYITTSRYEGLPLSVIEAMSLGKAVIASDKVGNRDCVTNNVNGYLLPLDINLYAEKIVSLCNKEDVRLKFGMESRKIFLSNFCIDTQIDKLFNIYKSSATKTAGFVASNS